MVIPWNSYKNVDFLVKLTKNELKNSEGTGSH